MGQSGERLDTGRLLRFALAVPVYFILFMFLPAGDLAWIKGWIFVLVFFSVLAIAVAYLWRVNPEVIVARTGLRKGTKRWDKILLCFLFPVVYLLAPVAALDDGRFHWFPIPWWVCIVGYCLLLPGMALVTWAQSVNKFFEPTVRIQTDRGQTVVDTGPYAIVRHPGYSAAILYCVGIPLCLGSLWALIPGVLAIALLILRTAWEDQTLQAELVGYKEYTQRVRSKLIPGVW